MYSPRATHRLNCRSLIPLFYTYVLIARTSQWRECTVRAVHYGLYTFSWEFWSKWRADCCEFGCPLFAKGGFALIRLVRPPCPLENCISTMERFSLHVECQPFGKTALWIIPLITWLLFNQYDNMVQAIRNGLTMWFFRSSLPCNCHQWLHPPPYVLGSRYWKRLLAPEPYKAHEIDLKLGKDSSASLGLMPELH